MKEPNPVTIFAIDLALEMLQRIEMQLEYDRENKSAYKVSVATEKLLEAKRELTMQNRPVK
jgi:hypothetical protein